MIQRPGIVVVGSTMIDLVAYAHRLPEAGETVVGTSYRQGFGGKGANQAVAAARFGASVAMVNALGDDAHGSAYLENFTAEGIDTQFVRRVPGSSGVAPIWVDGAGSNRIIIIPGANLAVPPELAVEAVERLRPAVVIGQFEIPQAVTTAAFAAARGVGAVTILNPAPAAPVLPALLAVTDWLVPNETEFALIAGAALSGDADTEAAQITAFALRVGVAVAVTLGERGVALVVPGGSLVRIAAPAVQAIDTTGAGDAFVGAFGVGLGLGWTAEASARLGCAAASDSVTRAGTQSSYPDREGAAALLAAVQAAAGEA